MPITVSCEHCGKTLVRSPSHVKKNVFCSKSCAYAGRIKAVLRTRRMMYRPKHPLRDKNGFVAEHRAVLFERIGRGWHKCHWCGCGLRWRPGAKTAPGVLIADHIDGDGYNNASTNLVPACQGCNTWRKRNERRSRDRVEDDELYVQHGAVRNRAVKRTCKTCGGEFLIAPSSLHRKNKGQFCSLRCMYDRNKARA